MGELGVSPRTIDDRQAQQLARLKRRTDVLWKTAGRAGREDEISSRVLIRPSDDTDNAVVVKIPQTSWGTGAYGTGQAFMLLREDYTGTPQGGGTATEPDRNVIFRVDRNGGIGTAGGIHVATGLRLNGRTAPNGGIWVQNYVDAHGIILQAANTAPVGSFAQCLLSDGTVMLDLKAPAGAAGGLIYNTTATFGHVFQWGGVTHLTLTALQAAFDVGLSLLELGGPGTVGNAPANRGFLYLEDNGAGKTQLCVRFNTGARIVLATEA